MEEKTGKPIRPENSLSLEHYINMKQVSLTLIHITAHEKTHQKTGLHTGQRTVLSKF